MPSGLRTGRDEANDRSAGMGVASAELLFRVSMLVAVFPILFSGVRAAVHGWLPTSDDANIAIRSHDVFTMHPPLIGPWSSASQWAHRNVALPGAMEDYVLALPVRLFGLATGTSIGMALVNALAVVGMGWLVRRRGGPALASVAMVFVVVLSWSLGTEMLFDPWQPHSAVFIFGLFLASAWSLADADVVGLPLLAFTFSYLVQTHPSYVFLVVLVLFVCCGLLWWRLRHSSDADTARFLPTLPRWSIASAAVVVLCWTPPLYQQATGSPGNLGELLRAARARPHHLSLRASVNVVGSTIALPPFWLPPSWRSPSFDLVGAGRPFALTITALLALIAVLAWLTRDAVQRGDRSAVSMLAVSMTALFAGVLTVWRAPASSGLAVEHVRWLWPLGMFVWFSVVAALLRREVRAPPRTAVRLAAVSVLLAATAGVLFLTTDKSTNASPQWAASVSRDLMRQARPTLREHRDLVVIVQTSNAAFDVGPAVMADLVARGIPFRVEDPTLFLTLGTARAVDTRRPRSALWIATSSTAPPGSHLIAQDSGLSRSESRELLRLTGRLGASLDANLGARLTTSGRDLVARVPLLRTVWQEIQPLSGHPDQLMTSAAFGRLAANEFRHGPLLDIGTMDQQSLRRWATLFNRQNDRKTFLYLRPA